VGRRQPNGAVYVSAPVDHKAACRPVFVFALCYQVDDVLDECVRIFPEFFGSATPLRNGVRMPALLYLPGLVSEAR
jgi:hypothetical protein